MYVQSGGVEGDPLRHVLEGLVGAAHFSAATLAFWRTVGPWVAAVLIRVCTQAMWGIQTVQTMFRVAHCQYKTGIDE